MLLTLDFHFFLHCGQQFEKWSLAALASPFAIVYAEKKKIKQNFIQQIVLRSIRNGCTSCKAQTHTHIDTIWKAEEKVEKGNKAFYGKFLC